jgi:hypothetical protein
MAASSSGPSSGAPLNPPACPYGGLPQVAPIGLSGQVVGVQTACPDGDRASVLL